MFKSLTLSRIRLYVHINPLFCNDTQCTIICLTSFLHRIYFSDQSRPLSLSIALLLWEPLKQFALFSIRVSMKFNSEPVTNASPIGFSPPLVS